MMRLDTSLAAALSYSLGAVTGIRSGLHQVGFARRRASVNFVAILRESCEPSAPITWSCAPSVVGEQGTCPFAR